MSNSPVYEEDVFVEDDLEEDEYLYQVAINFEDPKSQAIQSLEYEDDSEEDSATGARKKKTFLPHNPRSDSANAGRISSEGPADANHQSPNLANSKSAEQSQLETISSAVDGECAVEPGTAHEFAKTISAIDWGSIVQIKRGTAGVTPNADKFPFFGKTHKHWLHLLWDADPSEWVLVMLNSKLEESEENIDELPPTRKIYIRDITEVFLEVAPSTSFRIYLSAKSSNAPDESNNTSLVPHAASEEEALEAGVVQDERSDVTTPTINTQSTRYDNVATPNLPTVLRITPEPIVRWHAAMWVDALYAAMQLQIHEPQEEVVDIRAQYYDSIPVQESAQEEDGVDLGTSLDDARPSEIAYSDIYGPNGHINKDGTITPPAPKSCCTIS